MKNLILIVFIFSFVSVFGQFSRERIETDSSTIEITRNSIYRIYEETYKNNDSVWYSVTYIDDTTKLHREGWSIIKHGERFGLGIWKEYNREGDLLYTRDYDKHTCVVNPEFYPYHDILEKMKLIADSLIIDAYGQEFMDKHVVFEFDCSAWSKYKTKYSWAEDSVWAENFLGSWIEPLKSKPDSFRLRYQVWLNPADKYSRYIELGIFLDEHGNYVAKDDTWTNLGFELVKPENKKFIIDKNQAIVIAKQNGLVETDTSKIDEFLFWEKFRTREYYNGQFRYYIIELIGQEHYQKNEKRQGIKYKYMVYVFNPWTGEFVEKKKMKSFREWSEASGHSTGLLSDDE